MSASRDLSRDPWSTLRTFTRARIGLDRCGDGMSTTALLQLQLDHAHARDAVKRTLDSSVLADQLGNERILQVQSAAVDRASYVRRPDLGRRLSESSRPLLESARADPPWEVVFVIADGLSSVAVEDHAVATLRACTRRLAGWRLAPVVIAAQARVALGDEISVLLNADLCVVLIGERPGLSVANSLGIYLTWQPHVGCLDAERNCVSNVHADGLSYEQAAAKVFWLLSEARRRRLTGTALKENAGPQAASLTALALPGEG